jgi:hypothetical protein
VNAAEFLADLADKPARLRQLADRLPDAWAGIDTDRPVLLIGMGSSHYAPASSDPNITCLDAHRGSGPAQRRQRGAAPSPRPARRLRSSGQDLWGHPTPFRPHNP